MEIRRTRRPEDHEKYLVAEQPGMLIVLSGLVIAAILGFTVRGLINPSRVESLLRKAALQVHHDVHIDFETAQVSLHAHGWPRVAVIVNNVILNANQPCWMNPKLKVDEMVLPISFWNLFLGNGPIDEVKLGRVQLWLGEYVPHCQQTLVTIQNDKPTIPEEGARIKIKEESSKISDRQTDIHQVSIEELSIYQETHLSNGLFLQNVELNVNSAQPLSFDIQATLPVEKYYAEEMYGHVGVDLQYSEFPEKVVSWQLSGPLREGRIESQGKVSFTNNIYDLDINLEHIPWVQVMKIDQAKEQFKLLPRQSWLTANIFAKGDLQNKSTYELKVDAARIEGPQAVVVAEPFSFRVGEKVSWNKIKLTIEKFQLLPFIKAFGMQSFPNSLGDLGIFQGAVEIDGTNNFKIDGKLSGLEFIFSNLGQREKQLMSFDRLAITKLGSSIDVQLDDLKTDASSKAGKIRAVMDSENQSVEASFNLVGLKFSKNVTDLFSMQMGDKGISGSLKADWRKGSFSFLKWDLSLPALNFPRLKIKDSKVQGFKTDDSLTVRVAAPSFEVEGNLIKEYGLTPLQSEGGPLVLGNPNLMMRGNSLRELTWTGSAESGRDHFRLQGGWKPDGHLQGEISIHGSKNLQGIIAGEREKPIVQWASP